MNALAQIAHTGKKEAAASGRPPLTEVSFECVQGLTARALTLKAALWLALYPLATIAQPITKPPSSPRVETSSLSLQRLSHAVGIAAEYLERSCDRSGEFAYLVDTDTFRPS
jgi:hypothetical protein